MSFSSNFKGICISMFNLTKGSCLRSALPTDNLLQVKYNTHDQKKKVFFSKSGENFLDFCMQDVNNILGMIFA